MPKKTAFTKNEPKKLPEEILSELSLRGIPEEEILYSARLDRNLEGEFAPGFIVLTKEELHVFESEQLPGEVICFKGTENMLGRTGKRTWSRKSCLLSDMALLKVERNVMGGLLVRSERVPGVDYGALPENARRDGTLPLGESYPVAAFSGKCTGGLVTLERIVNDLLSGRTPGPELLNDREKEVYCPKCGTMYPDPERKLCPKCMNTKNIFFRILRYLKPHRGKLVIMFLCYIATAVLNLVWPYLNGTVLYDRVLSKNDAFLALYHIPAGRYALALGLVALAMIVTKLLTQAVGMLQGVLTARIAPDLVKELKNDVFTAMGRLSVGFFTGKQTGSLMTRVMYDADEVQGLFIDGLPYFITNVFSIIAMAVIMFRLNVLLAVVSLVGMPVVFAISWFMLPRLWHRYGKQHRANRSLNARINDNLNGARVVKAFGQEKNETERFVTTNTRVRTADLEVVKYDNAFWGIYTAAENLAALLVTVISAYLIIVKREFNIGLMMTFSGYVTQLTGPMDFFSHFFRWFTNTMNSAQRMFEIMDAVPEIAEKENAVHLDRVRGDIEMKHVTFGYEKNKPVLKDVSLRAEPGKMLGIVGRSGAGKTTIVSLISRLYDPQEGSVTLDGVDLKNLDFATLHGNVAMVSQETYIFRGTIAENIAYAKKDATREEIMRAARLASAHEFILRLPDGYDTLVGNGRRSLSGGERQRISIARAILLNPKILILDEATAAVDTETEIAIQRSINMLVKGRTTISIAHRLSTLRDASRLVVIDDGRVTEEGTHEELLRKKGTYYKLAELQTKALALKGLD